MSLQEGLSDRRDSPSTKKDMLRTIYHFAHIDNTVPPTYSAGGVGLLTPRTSCEDEKSGGGKGSRLGGYVERAFETLIPRGQQTSFAG